MWLEDFGERSLCEKEAFGPEDRNIPQCIASPRNECNWSIGPTILQIFCYKSNVEWNFWPLTKARLESEMSWCILQALMRTGRRCACRSDILTDASR